MAKRSRVPGTPDPRRRTLFVLPPIPDDASTRIKNSIAVRNAASVEGTYPECGVTAELYADTEHRLLFHAVFRHESWCAALPDGEAA